MNKILFLPSGTFIKIEKNKSILDIALENDISIEHYCGGTSSCNTCRILIAKGLQYFNEKSEDEIYQLEKINIFDDYARLACNSKIISDSDCNIEILIPDNGTNNESENFL